MKKANATADTPPADDATQTMIPGILPPFDHKAALEAIIAKNADVERARAIAERRKADAKTAKDLLDDIEASLGELIVEFEKRMRAPVPRSTNGEPGSSPTARED